MSKIEVNTIGPQCGTTVTVGEGAGQTVAVDAATVNLGRSGGTVNLTCGATQSGFGRTGTVDWDTSIHTGTVTAATGKGYFVNTTAGGITVNLPAAAVGSIVAVSDYASTAASNNITVSPNGSEKINGENDDYTISTAGLAVTLVYADATRGWKSVTGSDADATGIAPAYVTATGGSPCTGAIVCTNYKVHTFTGPGTFTVSCAGNACGSNTVDYLVIAGGGSAGNDAGGGGGAGGYRESNGTASGCYTVSPLATTPTTVPAITVTATGYPIVVGGGGAAPPAAPGPSGIRGAPGNTSSALCVSSAGGGGGGTHSAVDDEGIPGGSGGGGRSGSACGGAGNTPPTTPPQGQPGGGGVAPSGGGGATTAGASGPAPGIPGGVGGTGATSSINATPTGRAGGGGGGGAAPPTSGGAATCGGGAGQGGPGGGATPGNDATVNTGGGGGGGGDDGSGGGGGSGIVIIRYKFQ
jgi:hypothetical protein